MKRIVLTDGSGRWFDLDKTTTWKEDTRWDGHNNVSVCAERFGHEELHRTAGGRFVLNHWSQWQGSMATYEEISVEEAARWLSVNGHHDDAGKAGAKVADALKTLEVA